MNVPVRVIPNFLSTVECAAWMQLINELEISRPQDFTVYKTAEGARRLALQFGEKLYDSQQARPDLSILGESRAAAAAIFSRIIKETGSSFADSRELYPSIFWLAKQYPGSRIDYHEDTDGGSDSHITYSSLVYLNSQRSGGELKFPRYGYTYVPQAGDLIIFGTQQAGMHGVTTIHEERYSLPVWLTVDPAFKLS